MTFRNWFFTFAIEKGWYTSTQSHLLNDLSQEVQDFNIGLDFEFFLDFVCNSLTTEQKNTMKSNFVRLDFANADCRDFLHHIINAVAKVNGMNEFYTVKFAN
jgi:hypothetical protein